MNQSLRRDLILVGVLWALLTLAGELFAAFVDFYPQAMSDKGEKIEDAFQFLVFAAVPVFALVVAVLLFTIVRHSARTGDEPPEDGPPYRGRGAVPLTWFGASAALTLIIMIYPGLIGIPEMFTDAEAGDLTVEVTGVQWAWIFDYPDHDVRTINELALPVDREVTFKITSQDVLHSFFVPAFLMKIDAVPGLTTTLTLRPTHVGSFESNEMLRVQCAELCGLAHSRMVAPIQVMSEEDFRQWLDGKAGGGAANGEAPAATTLQIVAQDLLFDRDALQGPPDQPFAVELDNRDEGTMHNFSVYTDASAQQALFVGDIFPGVEARTFQVPALESGEYFFRCDVHPTTMTGTLRVR
jgi:cytochrome c oxidase subunit 2